VVREPLGEIFPVVARKKPLYFYLEGLMAGRED